MEEILSSLKNLEFDTELLPKCNIVLLKDSDINSLKELKDDFKLQMKLSIQYDELYDRMHIGLYYEVPEDYKRMFMVLSLFKVRKMVILHA